jgi:hypothetical protein
VSDDLDARLRHSLDELARGTDTIGVYQRVAAKRAHRRRARSARAAGLGVAALLVVALGVVALARDDSPSTVATGDGSVTARVVDGPALGNGPIESIGRDLRLVPVPVTPDEGYVRTPLLVSGDSLALAAYDRVGNGFTVPPSRVVRVQIPGGGVDDQVDLQGEILSLADGEGARWALTRDLEVLGPEDPEFRVKRIGPDGAVVSNPVPPGSVPAGDLVAGGGGVWLPTRTAVLRFDPVTGEFVARTDLDVVSARRGVAALGKFVAVTDGNAVRRLDPSATTPPEVVATVPAVQTLTGITGNVARAWVLDASGPGLAARAFVGPLDTSTAWTEVATSDDTSLTALRQSGDVVWLEGIVRGRRAAMVLSTSKPEIVRTILLPSSMDATFAFLDRAHAVVAVDGALYSAELD